MALMNLQEWVGQKPTIFIISRKMDVETPPDSHYYQVMQD